MSDKRSELAKNAGHTLQEAGTSVLRKPGLVSRYEAMIEDLPATLHPDPGPSQLHGAQEIPLLRAQHTTHPHPSGIHKKQVAESKRERHLEGNTFSVLHGGLMPLMETRHLGPRNGCLYLLFSLTIGGPGGIIRVGSVQVGEWGRVTEVQPMLCVPSCEPPRAAPGREAPFSNLLEGVLWARRGGPIKHQLLPGATVSNIWLSCAIFSKEDSPMHWLEGGDEFPQEKKSNKDSFQ